MPNPTKSELRKAMLAARGQVSQATAQAAAQTMATLLPPLIPSHTWVAGYMPMRGEVDILPALRALHSKGVRLALPKVLAGGEMVFLPWEPEAPLEIDRHGVLSPHTAAPVVPTLWLVPLLAFDKDRFRLGYGGGYYDRAIAAHTPSTIGIAYAFQYVDKLPRQAHDMPLDSMATEEGMM